MAPPSGSRPTFRCFVETDAGTADFEMADLWVHPSYWFQPGPSVPLELFPRAGRRDRFLQGYPLAWVEHPRTHVLTAFWIPREWYRSVSVLKADSPSPALAASVRASLVDAGILVARDRFQADLESWRDTLTMSGERFAADAYVTVPGLLHPRQIRALAVYYEELVATLETIGDAQCSHRFVLHNESVSRFVHQQLLPVVGAIARERLTPSFTYFAGYRPGAVLHRHTDREQCEVSVSILLGCEPAPDGRSTWPLFVETPRGVVEVRQRIGDALIFKGRRLPHWRPTLPDGHRSDSLLLHYVRPDFSGPLQ